MVPAVHNENASLANLARMVLSCVDRRRETTPVQTATLVLLLTRLIELVAPAPMVLETRERTVRELVAQFGSAEQERDDNQRQAKGEPAPPRRAWG